MHLILHQGYPIQYNGNADNTDNTLVTDITCILRLNIKFSQYTNKTIKYVIKIFEVSE